MAAKDDSEGSKDQKPTKRRLDDARKKGQVSQSKELTAAVSMAVGMVFLAMSVPSIFLGFRELFVAIEINVAHVSTIALQRLILAATVFLAQVTIPLVVVVALVAILCSRIQAGPVFSIEPIKPKGEKVNPAKNAKQIFSMKSLVMVALMVAKSIVIGIGFGVIFFTFMGDSIRMILGGTGAALTVASQAVTALAIWAVAGYLMLAGLDLGYQRFQFQKDMRMSLREIRRENKEDEGDPIIKSARRGLAQQPSISSQLEYVDRAGIVLNAGDGRVIALLYRPELQPKPVVVARAAGELANQVLEIARQSEVPVVPGSALLNRLWPYAVPSHTVPGSMSEEIAQLILQYERR